MKDLPIYDITIEDDAEIQGVSKISLVDVPAIGVNWIALRKVELPKTMMAVKKKKPTMAFVKKECFGCPPNGDGTKANGEPDRRCKGDGAEKTPKGGGKAPKIDSSTKSTASDVATPQQSISRTTQIGSTMGIIIDDKAIIENAKKAGYTVSEDVFAANKTIKIYPGGTDKAVFDIVYNPKGNMGKAAGKPYLSIQDPGRGGESFLEQYRKSKAVQEPLSKLFPEGASFKKQTFAKKECLGCPPNGDGTRVNGEPDRRCKDTKGEGGGKARAGKTAGSTKSLDAGKKNMENLFENNVEIVGQFGQVQTVLKPEVFEASKEPFKQFSAKAPIGEPPRIGEDTGFKVTNSSGQEFTVYKTDKLYEDNENRGNSYDRKDAAYHESKDGVYFIKRDGTSTRSDILVLGYDTSKAMKEQFEKASGIKVKPSVQYNWNDVQQSTSYFSISYGQGNPNYKPNKFRKQTFAKKECLGCPPNGDGTRVNGDGEDWSDFLDGLEEEEDTAEKLNKIDINFKTDEEKKMLFGPFLIPNKLIYRKDDKNGEYYVRFSSDEIKKIAEKFNEQLKNKEINLMHTDEGVDAFVFENWVIEGSDDKSKKFGFDLPEGTWFGGVKIKDDKFWNDEVKSGKVKGFSVEILANLELKMIKKIKKNKV